MGQNQSRNIEILNELLSSSNSILTTEDISRIKEKFDYYDLDGNGTISLSEFRSFKGLDENPLIDRIFKALDQNNDGQIDFYEFCTGLSIFAGGSSSPSNEKKISFLFKTFDFDDDGFINDNDLISCLKLLLISNNGDDNENGKNLLTDQQIKDLVRAEIARNDLDGDEKLSYEEFSKIIEKFDVNYHMHVDIK